MGRSLYRGGSVRLPLDYLTKNLFEFALGPFLFFIGFLGLFGCKQISTTDSLSSSTQEVLPLKTVAALGQLSPAGEVRRLAAPTSGFGGTPRIARLLVIEGDSVLKGQGLAIFDNRPQILADLSGVQARIQTLDIKIKMQEKEISRYKQSAIQGATALVLLEDKQDELVKLKGQRNEELAKQLGLTADLSDSELKSPIDGVVLRVHSREGERPGNEGVIEVGASQDMKALIEVYESDVNRVKIGQKVVLVSENGGFKGSLFGLVERISPQVRQRRVLSTDPTGDADARVVEVLVGLNSESVALVKSFTGMKVIARFQL